MNKEKLTNRLAISGIVVILIFSLILCYVPNILTSASDSISMSYKDTLFDKNSIMSVQISMPQEDWTEMLANATAEEYYSCDVTINGVTYMNVGIRPKGNTSLSQVASDSTTDRFSFKLEFDHYVESQTCNGLDKLILNNLMSDATYRKEYIAYDIMQYLGVTSSLFSYADIDVNGEDWGLYLAFEAVEESFALRNYGASYGNFYKPDSLDMGNKAGKLEGSAMDRKQQAIEQFNPSQMQNFDPSQMEDMKDKMSHNGFGDMGGFGTSDSATLAYIDDDIESYNTIFDSAVFDVTTSDKERLIASLKNITEGANLEESLDIDAMLRYITANAFVVNDDSYFANMAHNYYLYEKNGKLTMLPWDYNLAFGGFNQSDATDLVNRPIDSVLTGVTDEQRPLISQIMNNNEYLQQYHEYMEKLISGYFESGYFEKRMSEIDNLIDDYVKNDPTAFYSYDEYLTAKEELLKFCTLRAESIRGQLNGSIPSTEEGQSENLPSLIDASSVNVSAMGTQGGGNKNMGDSNQHGGKMDWFNNQNQGEMTPPTNQDGNQGQMTPPTNQDGNQGQMTPPTNQDGNQGQMTPPTNQDMTQDQMNRPNRGENAQSQHMDFMGDNQETEPRTQSYELTTIILFASCILGMLFTTFAVTKVHRRKYRAA